MDELRVMGTKPPDPFARTTKDLKRWCHDQTAYALKTGRLRKPSFCQACNRCHVLEAHHDDYSNPLEVIWLCVNCHRSYHNSQRKGCKYSTK